MTSSAARVSSSSPRGLECRIIDWLSQVALQSTTAGHEFEDLNTDTPSCRRRPAHTQNHGENPHASLSRTPRPRKRRTSGSPVRNDPISPPLTAVDARDSDTHNRDKMHRTPSPKKRRMDVGSADLDMTPRARHSTSSAQPPFVFPASASSRESTSDASSQHSGTGTSSPRKQMAALAVDSDGMVRKLLRRGAEGMPKELADLYEALNDCNMGVGVVTRAHEVCEPTD